MDDLKAEVEANGGVQSFPMSRVRDAYGAGRLGVHVRTNISKSLQGLGLGHFPSDLPDSQDATVRLFKLGSPVADLIDAVLRPGAAQDQKIRDASGGNAEEVLAAIREIVCS
jgi:hypothetical protein